MKESPKEVKELDQDTKKILSEGERMINLTSSEEWKEMKKRLVHKCSMLDSLSMIPESFDKDKFLFEARVRQGVVSVIMETLREIEGDAERGKQNSEVFTNIREEEIIRFYK